MLMAMAVDHRLGGGEHGRRNLGTRGRGRGGVREGNYRPKKKKKEKAEKKNRFDRFGIPFT